MKNGFADYFSSGWNLIDVAMYILMVASYITWITLYVATSPIEKEIREFADGIFSLAIILSFFRVVYLCQITRYLGLLQLCLGRMVQVGKRLSR